MCQSALQASIKVVKLCVCCTCLKCQRWSGDWCGWLRACFYKTCLRLAYNGLKARMTQNKRLLVTSMFATQIDWPCTMTAEVAGVVSIRIGPLCHVCLPKNTCVRQSRNTQSDLSHTLVAAKIFPYQFYLGWSKSIQTHSIQWQAVTAMFTSYKLDLSLWIRCKVRLVWIRCSLW